MNPVGFELGNDSVSEGRDIPWLQDTDADGDGTIDVDEFKALAAAAGAITGASKLAGLVGDLAPVEAAYALKLLLERQGGVVECRTDGAMLPAGNRSGYVGTARIEDIDGAKHIVGEFSSI